MVVEDVADMSTRERTSRREQVAVLLALAERNEHLMRQNPPGWLEPYRGQWVLIDGGKVVAHSPDGSGLREMAPIDQYPAALILRVPTREEEEAVLVI